MQRFLVFLVGLVFGTGLVLSGMADPARVLGFLDLSGLWDPSLALVMGGAIVVGFFAFRIARKRTHTLIGGALRLPRATAIDKRLVLGSLVFGAGWGLAGFCPGPAIVAIGSGHLKAVAFVAAMLVGMLVYELTGSYMSRRKEALKGAG
ncbi:MAG: hypothetical protein EPN46_01080 [Candidimonas sp.]|nr:MAG: hypothetical protein EPN77_09025 [Candidimonas sp.]TAM26707.1 MAG: hypothetical protein EPN62_01360 [Candidimonas sp.]TAM80692.1 MAG: hypothetical protein EPN46_01080 [Candidimonas sp.]